MNKEYILCIDPGDVNSAYAILDVKDDLKVIDKDLIDNNELTTELAKLPLKLSEIASCDVIIYPVIEMIASYGMPVGKTVFETCVWIGRFHEQILKATGLHPTYIYRKDIKMNLCNSTRAKDGNVRQALIDRFGVVGTKNNQGHFYGVRKDIWSAIAVGVTYYDNYLEKER